MGQKLELLLTKGLTDNMSQDVVLFIKINLTQIHTPYIAILSYAHTHTNTHTDSF